MVSPSNVLFIHKVQNMTWRSLLYRGFCHNTERNSECTARIEGHGENIIV